MFLERMRLYLTGDVSNDMESMVSPAPQLTYLKQLFGKESDQLHQQLDRLMAQVDLVQGLFERAGGAKDSHTKKRRSKYGVGLTVVWSLPSSQSHSQALSRKAKMPGNEATPPPPPPPPPTRTHTFLLHVACQECWKNQ